MSTQTVPASQIGVPTGGAKVTSATLIPAAPQSTTTDGTVTLATPEYCRVLGTIASTSAQGFPINFVVNLPTSWNTRAMQMGGGGMNGSIDNATASNKYPERLDRPTALARGYATFSSDSGHSGNNGVFLTNFEAVINFGYAQMKKTKDVAFALIKQRYAAAPSRSYCYGHSNGGRDCMAAIQHYPLDYDGVVANEAVVNYTGDMLHNVRVANRMVDGGWLSPEKISLLGKATRNACDALDGIVDGVIAKYHACNFDARTLRCTGGTDTGNTCLSDAQLATIDTIQKPTVPLPLANGSVYPGFQWKGGEDAPDGYARVWTGTTAPLKVEPAGPTFQSGVGFILVYGRSFVRYWFGGRDDYQTYSFDESQYQSQIAQVSSIIDATNPDLTAFFAHGGKLIMKDNSNDYAQSPQQRIQYMADMAKVMGQKAVDDSFRWFVAAGAGHFGLDGPGLSDHVEMIENWVEKGQAPADSQLAVQNDTKTLSVIRSLPMCRYPMYPRYNGSGDVKLASSFTCSVQ